MDTSPIIWRIDLFGRLRAFWNDQTIERFPTQKTGTLLALLAFSSHRRHSREELAGILWPDADSAAARDRLSQALVWLRPRLEPEGIVRGSVLETDRLSIGFHSGTVTTDVAEFETALNTARRATDSSTRKKALEQAIALYQGDLLPDNYSDWVFVERQRLQSSFLIALRHLVTLYEQEGDFTTALEYARRALGVDVLQEESHADLIRLLVASGQTAAALRQFQDLKTVLARELGAEPSIKIQKLVASLGDASVRAQTPPTSNRVRSLLVRSTTARSSSARTTLARATTERTTIVRASALPKPLTRFFGREAELERLSALVLKEKARLVTLTGIGGAGKTRLALAAATNLMGTFGESVAFVPAADLDNAQMLPSALAAVLHLPISDSSAALNQVMEALAERPFLIILDNLEHIQVGASALVRELLDRVPTLTILATSRQRLGLEGEQEVSVSPLPFPSSTTAPGELLASASIQLFVDRARSVRPDFAITPANAETVSHLCERLDGIPLAIELCAAWAQTLTPSQMLEKLDQRFDLLVSRRADITPRHRTLRAAVEYSFLLLPADLRRLFIHLSVFRGGWSLEAAVICSEEDEPDSLSLLAGLTELRERSLVVADEVRIGENDTRMRYRMLETLREFGAKQLTYAERVTLRRAHAAYFMRFAEEAEAGTSGPEQEQWLTHLEAEQENLRTVLAWSLETDQYEWGLRLASALRRYWWLRGYLEEGYQWLEKLLDRAVRAEAGPLERQQTIAPEILAKAWAALGLLIWSLGNYTTAREAHEKALALRRMLEDRSGVAESLYHLGITMYRQDDYAAARIVLDESLSVSQELGDSAGIARVLLNLGNIAYEQQSYPEARTFFQQSLDLEKSLGNRQRVADTLTNLGVLALAEKDYPKANEHLQQALTIRQGLTDNFGYTNILLNLGMVARLIGEKERARTHLSESLRLAYEVGNRHILAHTLLQMGILESTEGKHEQSVTLIAAAQHLFEVLESSRWGTHADGHEEALAAARAFLGDTAFEVIWSEAMALTSGQAVEYALATLPVNHSENSSNK